MEWMHKGFALSWVVLGAWVALKPRALSSRIARKGSRKLRLLFTGVGVYLSATLIVFSRHLEQPYRAALLVVALVGIIKAISLLRGAAAEKLGAIAERLPAVVLRLAGVVYILFGVWLYARADAPRDGDPGSVPSAETR